MRNVYVLDGEFSGATRGFLSTGSTRRETIFRILDREYNEVKVERMRAALVDAESKDGALSRATRVVTF